MCASRRTGDDGFEAARRRNQQVIDRPGRMFGIVISEWHPVERHDFKCLSIQLQVQIAIRRSVHHTPELPLVGCDLDSRANYSVHRKDFLDSVRFCPASLGWNFNSAHDGYGIWIMLDGAAAYYEHALGESFYFRDITFQ